MAKTAQLFSNYLNQKRTLQGIDFSPQGDAVSRLQLLNLSGLDYQGQVSSGYSHLGIKGSFEVSLDLVDFLLPMVPIPGLELSASVKFSGQGTKEYLLLIQRYPQYFKQWYVQVDQMGRQNSVPHIYWSTRKPLCFLGLNGHSGVIDLSASVNAGAGFKLLNFGDELGINLSASAGVTGNLTGKFIRLDGSFTGAFPSPSDIYLVEQSSLEQVVDYLFSIPEKQALKQEVDGWIQNMVTQWLNGVRPEPVAPADPRMGYGPRQPIRERRRDRLLHQLQRVPLAKLSDDIQTVLNDHIFSKVKAELRIGILTRMLTKFQEYHSTTSLRDRLNQLSQHILTLPASSFQPGEKIALLRQIQEYQRLLMMCYKRIDPLSVPNLYTERQSYFDLFSISAGASASAQASASAHAQTPPVGRLQIQATAEAGAMANARVAVEYLTSRYQSSLRSGNFPVIFTQDSWVTYRHTQADASAFAKLSLSPIERDVSRQGELTYRSMSYVSSALYWRYRREVTDPYYNIVPEPGSGIRCGISVATRRLIQYANNRTLSQISQPITRALRIPASAFDQFIEGADFGSMDPNQEGFPKYVFLESAFYFPPGFKPTIKVTSGGRHKPRTILRDPQIGDRQAWGRLESLRLRIRISDMDTNETPLFKIGFKAGPPQIGIDTSSIRGAGQEGMFDYYAHWFSNPTLNTDPGAALAAQETSIPPVILIHQ